MRLASKPILFAFLIGVAPACSGNVTSNPVDSGPLDSGSQVQPDAGSDVKPDAPSADSTPQPGDPQFAPDGASDSATLAVVSSPDSGGGLLTLDVVVGPQPDVFGVGSALRFDPTRLELLSFESLGSLDGLGGIATWRENPPGRIVFAITKKGEATGQSILEPLPIARLVLRPKESGSSRIDFVPSITDVRNSDFDPVTESPNYVGGEITVP